MKKYLLTVRRNKYKIVIVIFLLWMLFFDDYNLFFVYKSSRKLSQIKAEQIKYKDSIDVINKDIDRLNNDSETIEKYARENLLMLKPNEDLFIVVEE
ncbi:MAG: FtsB family cell division protein [Solitalea-like symbiont of Acarus siro]